MPDVALTVAGAGSGASAPLAYQVPGAGEIILKGGFARMDGSATSAPWIPCLRVKTPNGGIMLECVGNTVAAGASADVSWFPSLGGGSVTTGKTSQLRIPSLDTPDNSGNAFPALSESSGFSNVQRLLPAFTHAGDGSWTGAVRVPQDYGAAPQVIVSAVVNATTGVVRWVVASAVVAAGSSEDTAFTSETAQNITVPGTALLRFDTTFSLSTTPTPGADLNIKITRNAANVADTCTANVLVWATAFQYLTS